MPEKDIKYLIPQFITNLISRQELSELLDKINSCKEEELDISMLAFWESLSKHHDGNHINWDLHFASIIKNNSARTLVGNQKSGVIVFISRIVSVASILLLMVMGYKTLFVNVDQQQAQIHTVHEDIAPGTNAATITLSNGKEVKLDSTAIISKVKDGKSELTVRQGMLQYESQTGASFNDESSQTNLYNTVTTERGKQWRLTLPDGTKVWLNAASSIHYPLFFNETNREIDITGEAYFEVATLDKFDPLTGKNNKVPFMIHAGGTTVKVFGTHFNIHAYPEDGSIKTTLLEGKVQVSKGNDKVLLVPGQQAETGFGSQNDILVLDEADLDEAVAWKNGMTTFHKDDIRTVMNMIGRWYNVNVEFDGKLTKRKFSGEVPRSDYLSSVLAMLEYAGIHFRIENRTVIVKE